MRPGWRVCLNQMRTTKKRWTWRRRWRINHRVRIEIRRNCMSRSTQKPKPSIRMRPSTAVNRLIQTTVYRTIDVHQCWFMTFWRHDVRLRLWPRFDHQNSLSINIGESKFEWFSVCERKKKKKQIIIERRATESIDIFFFAFFELNEIENYN